MTKCQCESAGTYFAKLSDAGAEHITLPDEVRRAEHPGPNTRAEPRRRLRETLI
ncbi:MAG: hypothetical protein LKK19_02975 [Bacteroidales bacterium]|jgi:hypothetical protein|nr:hypothetical protein [Bacteroidales bacterium]MCI2121649.1 hypothetical protein [Bacteroidales bacterium]MCI2144963.1 hypothetical protein [Bacteroidales bacterium]